MYESDHIQANTLIGVDHQYGYMDMALFASNKDNLQYMTDNSIYIILIM